MKQQLEMLHRIITEIDNNPQQSMLYFTGCVISIGGKTPPRNARELLITDALHRIEHQIQQNDDCLQVDCMIGKHWDRLNNLYQQRQHLCWASHTHHFHPNFVSYVNCPVTCLAEISDFLQRLEKELYTT